MDSDQSAATPAPDDSVLAALATTRATRRFLPDPVAPELLETLVWAATRAPSPENIQDWEFVVVADPQVLAEIGELVAARADVHAASLPPAGDARARRTQESAKWLVRNFGLTPAVIFVCRRRIDFPSSYAEAGVGFSSVFMAAANILVAARSLGLGAAFTFTHMLAGPALEKLLGLPDDVSIAVTIPVGWPVGSVGPVSRRPYREVLHWDHFR